jgi:hypothetical protein
MAMPMPMPTRRGVEPPRNVLPIPAIGDAPKISAASAVAADTLRDISAWRPAASKNSFSRCADAGLWTKRKTVCLAMRVASRFCSALCPATSTRRSGNWVAIASTSPAMGTSTAAQSIKATAEVCCSSSSHSAWALCTMPTSMPSATSSCTARLSVGSLVSAIRTRGALVECRR